jgi:hypothetical protein
MPVDLEALWPTMLKVARSQMRRMNGRGLANDPEELAALVAVALLKGTRRRAAISLRELVRLTNFRAMDYVRWAKHNLRGERRSPVDIDRVASVLIARDDRERKEDAAERVRLVCTHCSRGQRRVIDAVLRHGTQAAAAKSLGCTPGNVSAALRAVRERNGR